MDSTLEVSTKLSALRRGPLPQNPGGEGRPGGLPEGRRTELILEGQRVMQGGRAVEKENGREGQAASRNRRGLLRWTMQPRRLALTELCRWLSTAPSA